MNLEEAHEFLLFWINKHTGAWYTPEELDSIIDRGQMSYYADCILRYGTSQRLRDALTPFKSFYSFTTSDTPSGVITIPPTSNFVSFLDGYVVFTEPRMAFPHMEIVFPNEDELQDRLRSQVEPVTKEAPLGEWIGKDQIQLYPNEPNTGRLNFYRRPVKPVFVYSVVSGRVIVYNDGLSTQLEWHEGDINAVLLKALSSLGINLREQDVSQFAEMKTQQNSQNTNKT